MIMKQTIIRKFAVLAVAAVSAACALADDTPTWIGLDTTLRDQQVWTAPVETVGSVSLDTRVSDFLASVGETIRGVFHGFAIIIR